MIPINALTTAAGGAAIGAVGVFWNQAKGIFSRFRSIFIVSSQHQGSTEQALMAYFWKHFKVSRLGDRRFFGTTVFIRPKNRFGLVAFESPGKSLTFFDGFKPLFISVNVDQNGYGVGGLTMSFIRGTFSIEDLIVKSITEYDQSLHETGTVQSRYKIRNFFGKKTTQHDDGDSGDYGKPQASSVDPSNRPLMYTYEELGSAISKTPFSNLSYGPKVKEFEDEVKRWKNSENWFKDRGLIWRFGACLIGPPGTGKTSFSRAIAQELDMPIDTYDLTSMDNHELTQFWKQSLSIAPCVVLFEDLDRVFDKDNNVKNSTQKSPLTLDALLNCISGVQQAEGILILVTVNDVSKLDSALGIPDENGKSTRPGRLDRAVHFGLLDEESRRKVASRILDGNPDLIEQTIKDGENETGAQFESRCCKLALEFYWSKK